MFMENVKLRVVDQCKHGMLADLHAYFDATLEAELAREDRATMPVTSRHNQRSHQSSTGCAPHGTMFPRLKGGEV